MMNEEAIVDELAFWAHVIGSEQMCNGFTLEDEFSSGISLLDGRLSDIVERYGPHVPEIRGMSDKVLASFVKRATDQLWKKLVELRARIASSDS